MSFSNTMPDDNNLSVQKCILDPLSVIIKLAIINNKPIGTKIRIDNNVIYLQEPGPFQSLCRFIFKNTKADIHYLYNPIELACQQFLTKEFIKENPKIQDLFKCAQNGLLKLSETYKSCSMMGMCINYYISIISNHLDKDSYVASLFKKNSLSHFYTTELISKLKCIWTDEKIKIILSLTTFLSNDVSAGLNVKSLETLMVGIDADVSSIIS